jgi:hypothetical protein
MRDENIDATPGLQGKAKCLDRILKQQKWIEICEKAGSYSGDNGTAIRGADLAELNRWKSQIAFYP